MALAALTGCLNVAVGITALANDIDLDDFESSVRVDFDPRVILMIHDVGRSGESFGDIDVEISVRGDDVSEEDVEVLAAGAQRSPVWNLMRLPHDMDPVVSVDSSAPTTD